MQLPSLEPALLSMDQPGEAMKMPLLLQTGKPDDALKALDEAQMLLKPSSLDLQLEAVSLQAHLAKAGSSCRACTRLRCLLSSGSAKFSAWDLLFRGRPQAQCGQPAGTAMQR